MNIRKSDRVKKKGLERLREAQFPKRSTSIWGKKLEKKKKNFARRKRPVSGAQSGETGEKKRGKRTVKRRRGKEFRLYILLRKG